MRSTRPRVQPVSRQCSPRVHACRPSQPPMPTRALRWPMISTTSFSPGTHVPFGRVRGAGGRGGGKLLGGCVFAGGHRCQRSRGATGSVDLFRPAQWSNGNARSSGWCGSSGCQIIALGYTANRTRLGHRACAAESCIAARVHGAVFEVAIGGRAHSDRFAGSLLGARGC